MDLSRVRETYETAGLDEADLAELTLLVREPPELLVVTPSEADLVDGTHGSAPTRLEFQEHVGRGAAFTCYLVVQYAVDTDAILAGGGMSGAGW